jgi:hypothetical protein
VRQRHPILPSLIIRNCRLRVRRQILGLLPGTFTVRQCCPFAEIFDDARAIFLFPRADNAFDCFEILEFLLSALPFDFENLDIFRRRFVVAWTGMQELLFGNKDLLDIVVDPLQATVTFAFQVGV